MKKEEEGGGSRRKYKIPGGFSRKEEQIEGYRWK